MVKRRLPAVGSFVDGPFSVFAADFLQHILQLFFARRFFYLFLMIFHIVKQIHLPEVSVIQAGNGNADQPDAFSGGKQAVVTENQLPKKPQGDGPTVVP